MIKFLDLQKINLKYQNEIEELILSVYRSGWFVLVKEMESFEKALANYCNVKNIIGVSNGFEALRLILKAYIEMCVMGEGDEVIVPRKYLHCLNISNHR